MVCHSLLQWTTFCPTSPPGPICLGWPHMAWLSFIELDKAVICVIRLARFLGLWFQCACPLMHYCNTYRLTWVCFTLDVGYLFTAAPAKCSHCSLPWTRSPLLTLNAWRSGAVAERCYPMSQVRGGGQEELPQVRDQGQRPRVPGCDSAGAPERSYLTSQARGGGQEELPEA